MIIYVYVCVYIYIIFCLIPNVFPAIPTLFIENIISAVLTDVLKIVSIFKLHFCFMQKIIKLEWETQRRPK
jgi:hypothetical protein